MTGAEGGQDAKKEEPEHRGLKSLSMLNLADIADTDFLARDGSTFKGKDFLDHCGEKALAMVTGLEMMDPEDPDFQEIAGAISAQVQEHLQEVRSA